MAAVPASARPTDLVLELQPGDRLTRAEFERRYAGMPHLKKAELIEGLVHIPSPVRRRSHASPHGDLVAWLKTYAASTQGLDAGDNATVRLDLDNEPQPDAYLLILPERGGQSRSGDDDYIEGAPELVVEVAASSASIDLHAKMNAYRRNGVREYVVWRTLEGALDWFALREGQYEPLPVSPEGVVESALFPGLVLDVPALLRGDLARVLDVLRRGLESPAHAELVRRLAR